MKRKLINFFSHPYFWGALAVGTAQLIIQLPQPWSTVALLINSLATAVASYLNKGISNVPPTAAPGQVVQLDQ